MAKIPFLKTLDIAKASALLAKYIADPDQEPVILTRKGKPLAILLPAQGGDVETISLSLSSVFHAIMERSRESYYQEGGIPIEEIRREFGLPPYKEKAKRKSRKPRTTNRKRSTDGSQV
jgi:hypothetical protein